MSQPTENIPKPSAPWKKIGIDITGPFWTAPQREEYIVVASDYYSNFPEILLTASTTTKNILHWLEEIFACYGNPEQIVTDNGPQFRSAEFEEFLDQRSIRHTPTPVYTPQQNGLVEVFNRTLKRGVEVISCQANSNFHSDILKLLQSFLCHFFSWKEITF